MIKETNPSIAIKTCSKCGFEKIAERIGDCTKCGNSEFTTSFMTLDEIAKESQKIMNLTMSKLYCLGNKIDSVREQLSNLPKQKEES